MSKILVLGAGTWGSVIANLLALNGHEVTCWARNENLINELKDTHAHSVKLHHGKDACFQRCR